MQKPDQANSRIRDMFVNRFAARKHFDELEVLKEQGKPLFSENDPIYNSTQVLDRFVIRCCQDNHITEPYFHEKYTRYAINVLGYHPTQASTQRSNMLKMMKKGNITFKRFIEFCCRVLDMPLNKMSFEFTKPSGERFNMELNDLSKQPIDLSEE